MRLWTWAKRWFWVSATTGMGAIWAPDGGYEVSDRLAISAVVFFVISVCLAFASDGEDKVDRDRRKHLEAMRRYDEHGNQISSGFDHPYH